MTIRKFSLLGLVLIAASAVTAAVMPKDGPGVQGELLDNASTTGGVRNQKTCVPNSQVNQCNATIASGSTGGAGTSNAVAASTASIAANNTTNGF